MELRFALNGQCPSGKNAVVVTRSGHRFPSKRFVKWREDALQQLYPQIKTMVDSKLSLLPLKAPVNIKIEYTAKDKIRRDAPGIIDAIWHLLEKAKIIADDTFLAGWGKKLTFRNCGVDKSKPGLTISITEEDVEC